MNFKVVLEGRGFKPNFSVKISDIADVQIGAAIKRGDGSFNGQKAVIVMINKQPQADTPTVTRAIEAAMSEIKAGLPKDIKVTPTFRQENYIDSSIENVREALIEGSIIVAIILIPFLMNWRNLAICLTALPLSLLVGVLLLNWVGQGLNTMTLGGLAVAIGSAVDDAIVDAENVYRNLRENKYSPNPRPVLEVVFDGCQEVRDSVFGATIITIVVFSPVFALTGVEQIQIKFNRPAASRYGLTVGKLSEIIETALNGRVVSQVLEKQQTFDLLVWLKPDARQNLDTIRNLLVDTPDDQKIPLAQVATIENGTDPNTINRENVSRLIVVSANANGRDLRSIVNEIQDKVHQQVQIPPDYYIQYAGQFEAEERATQNILIFSAIAFVAITVIMYLSVKSIPSTAMIMINLPLALVGGVFSVALSGGIISIASLVGFVTLFGVATRNGLLLVDNYNTKFAEGMPLKELLIKGSMERLNAILMTAFTSALGLAPLVIESGPGKEILQPLSIVVLGGLFTSTALTLVVLPALYAKFGKLLMPTN